MKHTNGNLFHYTHVENLNKINFYRGIKPHKIFIEGTLIDAIWLTTSVDWEETNNKSILDPITFEPRLLNNVEMQWYFGNLVRITVPADEHYMDWDEFLSYFKISVATAKLIEDNAKRLGVDPRNDWWVCKDMIYSIDWLNIEILNTEDQWETLPYGIYDNGLISYAIINAYLVN